MLDPIILSASEYSEADLRDLRSFLKGEVPSTDPRDYSASPMVAVAQYKGGLWYQVFFPCCKTATAWVEKSPWTNALKGIPCPVCDPVGAAIARGDTKALDEIAKKMAEKALHATLVALEAKELEGKGPTYGVTVLLDRIKLLEKGRKDPLPWESKI